MSDKGTFAFPQAYINNSEHGITIRDYFAAKAVSSANTFVLSAIAAKTLSTAQAENIESLIAKMSYEIADAMMEARK